MTFREKEGQGFCFKDPAANEASWVRLAAPLGCREIRRVVYAIPRSPVSTSEKRGCTTRAVVCSWFLDTIGNYLK